MINLKEYEKLKARVDSLARDKARAEGALKQLLTQMEEEFNCKTLKGAEKKLKQLEQEAAQATEDFHTRLKEIVEEWEDKLDAT